MRFLFTLLITCLLSFPVLSQESFLHAVCGKHNEIVEHLQKKYKEKQIGIGITNDNSIIEIYENSKRDTFTVVITKPDGRSCMIAAGKGLELFNKKGNLI